MYYLRINDISTTLQLCLSEQGFWSKISLVTIDAHTGGGPMGQGSEGSSRHHPVAAFLGAALVSLLVQVCGPALYLSSNLDRWAERHRGWPRMFYAALSAWWASPAIVRFERLPVVPILGPSAAVLLQSQARESPLFSTLLRVNSIVVWADHYGPIVAAGVIICLALTSKSARADAI